MSIDYTTIPKLRLLQVDSTGNPNTNNLSQIPDYPVIPIYGFTFVDVNNNPITFSGSGGTASSMAWANITGKPSTYPTISSLITDSTAIAQSILTAADAPTIRTIIGAGVGSSNFSGSYTDLLNIPPILPTVSSLIRDASAIGISLLTAPDANTVRNIINSTVGATTTVLAAPSVSGTVKVNTAVPDPLVYLKSDVDTIITALQTQISANTAQLANAVNIGGVITGITTNPQLKSTGIIAGNYTNANLTVDFDGRITGISSNPVQIFKTVLILTSTGSVATLDASLTDYRGSARITLTSNINLTCINFTDGQVIDLEITQSGSGSYTLTLPSYAYLSTTIPSITLSTAVGMTDIITLKYRQSSNKLIVTNFLKGFNA